MRITDEQVDHWRTHGYVVVPGYLTREQLDAALADAYTHFPSAEEYEAAPRKYAHLPRMVYAEFPFAGDTLNGLAVHPDFVDFMERAIGTADLRITQSMLWAKYPGRGDDEQTHHVDYDNNSLAFPSGDPGFIQVPSILYLTDVTPELGPTFVVSRELTADDPMTLMERTAETHPQYYEHEVPITVTAGSLLLYDMRTFHRGSRFRATSGARFTFHNVYRAAGCEWMSWQSFAHEAKGPDMARFLERANVRQRTILGFPAPGDRYWTEATLAGVAGRYPGMDMTPYREAVPASRLPAASSREVVRVG